MIIEMVRWNYLNEFFKPRIGGRVSTFTKPGGSLFSEIEARRKGITVDLGAATIRGSCMLYQKYA